MNLLPLFLGWILIFGAAVGLAMFFIRALNGK